MTGSHHKAVPVVFGFDESYVLPAGVCITSLLENSFETTSYEIHIIFKNMDGALKEKFMRMVNAYNGKHQLVFHDPGQAYDGCQTTDHFPTAMYYRFLIPALFKDYDKVIYSDVDVIFLDDLSHLMDIELGDNYLAAVTAKYVVHLLDPWLRKSNIYYLREQYFASGFLIFNIEETNKSKLIARLDELIRDHPYQFPDNDALNVACFDKVTYLHLKYCVPPFVKNLLELEINRCDDERMKMLHESIETPSIIHYLDSRKPWHGHVTTVYDSFWWRYYRKSIWYDRLFFIRYGFYKQVRYQARAKRRKLKKSLRTVISRIGDTLTKSCGARGGRYNAR